jgi:hypothetical protein
MLYRVAIQADTSTRWRWCSTVLSSLDAVFRFLQLYYAPLEHLLVFSSGSCEEIDEQLARENQGLPSPSVTAARFLHERLLYCPEREGGACQPMASIAVAHQPLVHECTRGGNGSVGWSMISLDRRRLELELGTPGDHDTRYMFTLPTSLPQVLAWTKLLAQVQDGAFLP